MAAPRRQTVPLVLATLLALTASARAANAPFQSLDDLHARLAARRHAQIDRLHAYAVAGRFPRNLGFPGQLVPYFVDASGTACAVGCLAQLDGLDAEVAHIAATNNHVRIADVRGGALLDWILDSGLTQAECALIQPSYACIEDYRRGHQWQDELTRLRRHFARVEERLRTDEQRSLELAMMHRIDAEFKRDPKNRILDFDRLADVLTSPEPNVRCAAAYAISRVNEEATPRAPRIAALLPNLEDPDPAVRFWTAVAVERLRPQPGHFKFYPPARALEIFMETARGPREDLRLAAFIQLAAVAPDCINTSHQLLLVPKVRRLFVEAADDKDEAVRELVRSTLANWRWQRVVGESRRMRRHYLNDSYELECLAADTPMRGREFADPPPAVLKLQVADQPFDATDVMFRLPYLKGDPSILIADTAAEAASLVEEHFQTIYAQYLNEENPPTWKIEPSQADEQGLYALVATCRTDHAGSPKELFIVPRSSMLHRADDNPHSWFERIHPAEARPPQHWAGRPPLRIEPRPNVRIVLGDMARNEVDAFQTACDIFASFIPSYSGVFIDRNIEQRKEQLVWSGRFASLRDAPRFGEGGVANRALGGGGWDFHRLTLTCDRATGELALAAEPIKFPIEPARVSSEQIVWETQELKLMSWRPLKSPDFFGNKLLPPEYHQAADHFDPDSVHAVRQLIYRRHHRDQDLPAPELFVGLLCDHAGRREMAAKLIAAAADYQYALPQTLVDAARWEFAAGFEDAARKHAEAALELWPENPVAAQILRDLDQRRSPDPS